MIRALALSLLVPSLVFCADANLAVKIGTDGGYEHGDILVAVNSVRALSVNAQNLMNPKDMPRTRHGTIEAGTLLEFYYERTYQYKFQRISETEVRRTNLWTSDIDVITNTPNSSGEYMDVPRFLVRRLTLKPNSNVIFGSAGAEYWYGGRTQVTDINMAQVWDEIESKTANLRSSDFPFSDIEKKHFLIMKVPDMKTEEAADLVAPLYDTDGETVLVQRKHKIDLTGILNAKESSDLSRKDVEHDIRTRKTDISTAIIRK